MWCGSRGSEKWAGSWKEGWRQYKKWGRQPKLVNMHLHSMLVGVYMTLLQHQLATCLLNHAEPCTTVSVVICVRVPQCVCRCTRLLPLCVTTARWRAATGGCMWGLTCWRWTSPGHRCEQCAFVCDCVYVSDMELCVWGGTVDFQTLSPVECKPAS